MADPNLEILSNITLSFQKRLHIVCRYLDLCTSSKEERQESWLLESLLLRVAKNRGLCAKAVCALGNDCDVVDTEHIGDADRREAKDVDPSGSIVDVIDATLAGGGPDAGICDIVDKEGVGASSVNEAMSSEV